MHLFPRSIKEKRCPPNTDVSSPQRVDLNRFVPDPKRKVFLTTFSKTDPMKRIVREIGRRGKQTDKPLETKKVDDILDAVNSLGQHTDEFNDLLRKLPKQHEKGVLLIMDRMRQEDIRMNAETYNLILEKIADVRSELCYEVYDDFQRNSVVHGVEPNVTTFKHLFRSCERNGDFERSFHYYSHMRQIPGLKADVSIYNTLIGYCAFLQDEAQASFFVEEMKDQGIEPDVCTYNSLMNVFFNSPFELLQKTFEDLLKRKIKPNRRTYNTLMKACQKYGDYDRAFQFFEELKHDGLVADVVTYNILLVLCRDRLEFVLGTGHHVGIRRTKEQREIGMKAVAELSVALFSEMEESEVHPNTFTYNAFLAVLGQCHDERVHSVFQKMKSDTRSANSDATQTDDLMTTWIAENAQLKVVAKLMAPSVITDNDEDNDGTARIASRGVRPNLGTFIIMIEASQELGMADKAYALFDELKESKIRPNKEAYVRMMSVCALKSERKRAYDWLREAKASGIPLDIDMLNALLHVLAECSDPYLFLELESAKTDGLLPAVVGTVTERFWVNVKPTIETYNITLKGCLKMRDAAHALAIYSVLCDRSSPLAGPDVVSFGILLDVCAQEKDIGLATELILDMKKRNVAPTIATYCRYMNVFVAAHDDGVVRIFDEIKKHGPAPNLDAYIILLQYYLARNDSSIVHIFDEMKSAGIDPDLHAYNILLDYCALQGAHAKSVKYYEELQSRGLCADIETYNALIKVYSPTGSEFVYKILEDMMECKIAPDHVTFSILMKHKAGRQCLASAREQQLIYVEPQKLIGAGPQ